MPVESNCIFLPARASSPAEVRRFPLNVERCTREGSNFQPSDLAWLDSLPRLRVAAKYRTGGCGCLFCVPLQLRSNLGVIAEQNSAIQRRTRNGRRFLSTPQLENDTFSDLKGAICAAQAVWSSCCSSGASLYFVDVYC